MAIPGISPLLSTRFQEAIIDGAAGKLEALIPVASPPDGVPLGIICHPHPLYGGTMRNKVVTTIARAWQETGAYPICFNYRGVGKSTGSYGDGIGETEDACTVIRWAEAQWPGRPLWLAGFSFGAYIALRAAQQHTHTALCITIAPAVEHNDFKGLQAHCPWLVIAAGADTLAPCAAIREWINSLPRAPQFIILPDANHFFDSQLLTLRNTIQQFITSLC